MHRMWGCWPLAVMGWPSDERAIEAEEARCEADAPSKGGYRGISRQGRREGVQGNRSAFVQTR